MISRGFHAIAWLCFAGVITGCAGNGLLSRLTVAPSPHERYANSLRAAALADTAMARDWLRAADEALQRPLTIALPLSESGYFPADAALKFGIYEAGAIDPLPFLQADDPVPAAPAGAGDWLSEMVRVTVARTTLRAGMSRAAPAVAQLDRASLARVAGVAGSQLRLVLPDRSTGYLDRTAVAFARAAVRRQRLAPGSRLREKPFADAPAVRTIEEATTADVIGEFNGFGFVRTASGPPGWIETTQQ